MKTVYRKKGVPNEFLGQWRSIEFEMIFKNQNRSREFAKYLEEKEYDKFVTIKSDGSVHPSNDDYNGYPREVVVSFRSGKEDIVRDICRWLKGNAYVNGSCGTHVHFDMRGANIKTVEKYGQRLAMCIPALKQLLPKSRRNSEWCEDDLNTMDGYNRYAFVNMMAYNRHKTIEVRAHSGTLNAKKILNWIKVCEKIMLNGAPTKQITKPEQLIKHYKFGKRLTDYVNLRTQQVNAPVAQAQAG